jgi:hypothetical protein
VATIGPHQDDVNHLDNPVGFGGTEIGRLPE